MSRKQKGSRNREKARQELNKAHARLADLRTDHLHQMTTKEVIRRFKWIGIEGLTVANMMKNHSLARALADASFGEIRRQLQYKTEWAGSHLVVADRFYPSSKLCSVCGYKHDALKQRDQEWTCPECGTRHDRDINASKNLESVARGSRDTSNACVTAPPEMGKRRSRGKTRRSKDLRAAAPIQECRAPSALVDELWDKTSIGGSMSKKGTTGRVSRTATLRLRIRPSEMVVFKKAARRADQTLSEWVRSCCSVLAHDQRKPSKGA